MNQAFATVIDRQQKRRLQEGEDVGAGTPLSSGSGGSEQQPAAGSDPDHDADSDDALKPSEPKRLRPCLSPSAESFAKKWEHEVKHAQECMRVAQDRQQRYANKRRRDVTFSLGDSVLLSTKNLRNAPGRARKFLPRYVGPFKVTGKLGEAAYRLELPPTMSRLHPVFHVSLLKKYTGSQGFHPPPVMEWLEDAPHYEVHSLLNHRQVRFKKRMEYLVKWTGYDDTYNTWEPEAMLAGAPQILSSLPPAIQPSIWPNDGQTFAQVVHTDGVTVSLLFTRPKPAGPPAKLPRMGKQEGAVNPLAHLDADWLGCDPGKTNMATVAHEERYPSGAVESVWQRSLTAGHYYRQSGITQHAKTSKAWMAGIQPEHAMLSQVTNYTASLQRYWEYAAMTMVTWPARWAELSKPRWSNARFRMYGHKQSTVAKFWAEVSRPLALAYGAAGFSGSGSIGSKGVPVKQMLREACKQFPGRVVLVHEFRTSRVSSARTNVVAGQAEAFRWLRPVRSMATRSRIRGLMCSTSIGIRFYDRDVSAALNIRRIAAGPGRPRELSSWWGRPAMPNPGRPGQEWVCVRDRGLLRKWQRRHQRQR
ncbi:hypothetical protein QJQ45_012094 [Haematococcus lacustris]|nr:hypothetical protein QJQ45_012094 [Haematococcus lacustris]